MPVKYGMRPFASKLAFAGPHVGDVVVCARVMVVLIKW